MWIASSPTTMRFQHSDVLFCNHIRHAWIQECYSRRIDRRYCQRFVHPRRSQGEFLRNGPRTSANFLSFDKIVDPVGRRRTMLFTLPIMTLALVLAAIFFYCKHLPPLQPVLHPY